MSEWVEEQSGRWTLGVGSLRAKITPQRDIFTWWIEDDLSSSGFGVPLVRAVATLDAAKAAAEQALREMHDALAMHFAPVLRWHVLGDQCDASLGDWILLASTGLWVARHRSGPRITSDPSCTLDAEQARRAAEAVLRSLGVVFRTEGE